MRASATTASSSCRHDGLDAQFFGARLSPDGKRVALTTNTNAAGARLVVLELQQ